MPPLRRGIRFDHVFLRYADGDGDILRDANFAIPAGRITAISGPSGSGKSSIADMIMGLVVPSAGRVLIDARPLDGHLLRAWRDRIAYVPQDVFLLNDSIAANLAMAKPGASPAEMWEALDASGAAGFVRLLPAGLETIVADRGIRLSGGERQRIALARALIRKPDLLILDEATSALDADNEALIAHSLEALRGTMTIVTIAHRTRMTALADHHVLVEDGAVHEATDIADRRVVAFPGRTATHGE